MNIDDRMWFDDGPRRFGEPADLDLCESPIERRFLRAFRAYAPGIEIKPQVCIGRWRADLIVAGQVAVECDGDAYHYCTEEQRRRDIDRDADFARLGYAVLRFSGAHINRDVLACCRRVAMLIEGVAA